MSVGGQYQSGLERTGSCKTCLGDSDGVEWSSQTVLFSSYLVEGYELVLSLRIHWFGDPRRGTGILSGGRGVIEQKGAHGPFRNLYL